MRNIVIICSLLAFASPAMADKYVKGYTKKDGTYVSGYYKSSSDSHRYNNYGSQTNGGAQADEYSAPAATNKSNPAWGSYDNDGDGISNAYDSSPDSKN